MDMQSFEPSTSFDATRAILRKAQALHDAATPQERDDDDYQDRIESPLRNWLAEVTPDATAEDRDEAVRIARKAARAGEEHDLVAVLQRVARRELARDTRRATRSTRVVAAPALRRARSRERHASRRAAARSAPSSEDGPQPEPAGAARDGASVAQATDAVASASIANPRAAVTPAQIDLLRPGTALGKFPPTNVVTAEFAAVLELPVEDVGQTIGAVRGHLAEEIVRTNPALAKKLHLGVATRPQVGAAVAIASALAVVEPASAIDQAPVPSTDDASVDIAANLAESKLLYQQLLGADNRAVQAKRMCHSLRVQLGAKLIEARKHFPRSGPNAAGWGQHCTAIGISTTQALRCMNAAGYKTSPTMIENPDDAAPANVHADLQRKWKTAPDQFWKIPSVSVPGAAHRILCGDSRRPSDVRRVMAGQSAQCMVTDPPWGNDYEGGTDDALTIANNSAAELPALLRDAFETANTALDDDAQIYVVYPDSATVEFHLAFRAAGWHYHETLIWVKDKPVLGHSNYQYQHEPILHGWKGKNCWHGERNQSSVLKFPRPKRSPLHPTSKPIDLLSILIENSTRAGAVVYEPFSGSGSTMLAAEKAGRVCCAIEIDPRYVAVALERFAAMGFTPTLEDGGGDGGELG